MSSIKSRKHYVILDMAFSGIWALFYAIAFIFMANSWRQSDEMFSFAKSNIIGAIFFAFLSVFCWVSNQISSYFSYGTSYPLPINYTTTIYSFSIHCSWVLLVLHTKGLKLDRTLHFLRDWAMKQWDRMVLSIKDIKMTVDIMIRHFKEEDSKVGLTN